MITSRPTRAQLERWKKLWEQHRGDIEPCRKTGQQLIDYLLAMYDTEEIHDSVLYGAICGNITENPHFSHKLPDGEQPQPRMFAVGDSGSGARLYSRRSRREAQAKHILVGVDTVSGCYHVEGSELLWDELCAYQGVDSADLENYVCTAMYVLCRERRGIVIGSTVTVTVDRAMGSCHPRHPDMVYPVNYGYVAGVLAPDNDWQDAYILGVDRPVGQFCGTVAAVIHRRDDAEDKWIVVPEGTSATREQIEAQTYFQERYFDSEVILL